MNKRIDLLVATMKANPDGVRFSDAKKVAETYFGPGRQVSTSHHVFKMRWAGDPRVNLQAAKAGMAKAYQVRQLLQAVEKMIVLKAQDEAMNEAQATTKRLEGANDV